MELILLSLSIMLYILLWIALPIHQAEHPTILNNASCPKCTSKYLLKARLAFTASMGNVTLRYSVLCTDCHTNFDILLPYSKENEAWNLVKTASKYDNDPYFMQGTEQLNRSGKYTQWYRQYDRGVFDDLDPSKKIGNVGMLIHNN